MGFIKKISINIFAICVILLTNSVYVFSPNFNVINQFLIMGLFVSMFFLIIHAFTQQSVRLNSDQKKIFFWLFVIDIIFLVLIIYNFLIGTPSRNLVNFILYIILQINFMTVLFSFDNKLRRNILLKISDVVSFIAILSLILYICVHILNVIHSTNIIILNWGGTHTNYSYYNIFFDTQINTDIPILINKMRNTSIFTEGPMFSLPLTLALAIELFSRTSLKKVRIFIILLCNFTTFSMTGWIFSIILIYIRIIFLQKKYVFVRIINLLLLVSSVIYFGGFLIDLIINKTTSSSFSVRLDDYQAQILSWRKNPITGNGINNTYSVIENMSSFRLNFGNTGQSNTVGILLSDGGVLIVIAFFIPMIKGIFYSLKKYKNIESMVLSLLLIAEIIFTQFPYTALMGFWIAFLLTNKSGNNELELDRS